jgi:hypothetical protein
LLEPETTPIARRRHLLSSSCTAPADRSPDISSRPMSLRNSTGRSNAASVSRSRGANANRASPIGELLWSSARTTPAAAPPSARNTFTVIFAAAFSAAASASADGAPPSKTVSVRSPKVLLRPCTNSAPRPVSTPSDSQAISQSPVTLRKRSIAGSVSTRSIE